jgi:hypothetical protein
MVCRRDHVGSSTDRASRRCVGDLLARSGTNSTRSRQQNAASITRRDAEPRRQRIVIRDRDQFRRSGGAMMCNQHLIAPADTVCSAG